MEMIASNIGGTATATLLSLVIAVAYVLLRYTA